MKSLILLPLMVYSKSQREICLEDPNSVDCKSFNILSLTSANSNGYMTARFVEFMEQAAYFSARSNECIEERDSGKVAMPELFDFIAGSGTGAIIAGSLVVPNSDTSSSQINENFADKAADFFSRNAS